VIFFAGCKQYLQTLHNPVQHFLAQPRPRYHPVKLPQVAGDMLGLKTMGNPQAFLEKSQIGFPQKRDAFRQIQRVGNMQADPDLVGLAKGPYGFKAFFGKRFRGGMVFDQIDLQMPYPMLLGIRKVFFHRFMVNVEAKN
jgi:hypothetical protein